MSRVVVEAACFLLLVLVLILGDMPLSAQVVPPTGEKIGQVSFPVSCAGTMQKPFERAVALLHSFWYLESAKAFAAKAYYVRLLTVAAASDGQRPEIVEARAFVAR
jgi:hypothetical protein